MPQQFVKQQPIKQFVFFQPVFILEQQFTILVFFQLPVEFIVFVQLSKQFFVQLQQPLFVKLKFQLVKSELQLLEQ
uniref:Uncharacterized protein n=1 Tax=viral metagenome TaxID=1070528 RepID=A0A6M3K6R2_9ZZZZ